MKVFAYIIRLNLVCEGICIDKQQSRVWVHSLGVTVVKIMHQRFQKIQDGKSHIDRLVQR